MAQRVIGPVKSNVYLLIYIYTPIAFFISPTHPCWLHVLPVSAAGAYLLCQTKKLHLSLYDCAIVKTSSVLATVIITII